MSYSWKKRNKQWMVTSIITVMNYNDHWNIMEEKVQIMLCS